MAKLETAIVMKIGDNWTYTVRWFSEDNAEAVTELKRILGANTIFGDALNDLAPKDTE